MVDAWPNMLSYWCWSQVTFHCHCTKRPWRDLSHVPGFISFPPKFLPPTLSLVHSAHPPLMYVTLRSRDRSIDWIQHGKTEARLEWKAGGWNPVWVESGSAWGHRLETKEYIDSGAQNEAEGGETGLKVRKMLGMRELTSGVRPSLKPQETSAGPMNKTGASF